MRKARYTLMYKSQNGILRASYVDCDIGDEEKRALPTISVVVRSYNQGKFLEITLPLWQRQFVNLQRLPDGVRKWVVPVTNVPRGYLHTSERLRA